MENWYFSPSVYIQSYVRRPVIWKYQTINISFKKLVASPTQTSVFDMTPIPQCVDESAYI